MLDKLKRYAGEWGSHFTFVEYAWRIGGVACTVALWVAAAMTPWLQAAGPFGWFLVALTGTALLAVASVPVADRFGRAWASLRGRREANRTLTAPDHVVREAETPEERQAKHELAAFVVDYVLPACRAQWALHEAIIARLCSSTPVVNHLALEGLKVETNVPEYLSSVGRLRRWSRDRNQDYSLEEAASEVKKIADAYHACCFFAWLCHGTDLDYKNDPEIGKFYASWKECTQQLVREYLRLMRDPRFGPMYNLSRTRTLGLDFCTNY